MVQKNSIINKRKIVAILIITLFIIFVYFIFDFFLKKDKVKVEIVVYPKDAEVTIDNKIYKNKKYIYLENNKEYPIKISKEGFDTIETKQYFNDNKKIILEALSTNHNDLIQKYHDDYILFQQRYYEKLEAFLKNRKDKYPFVDKLPIIKSGFKIGHRIDGDNITIVIYANQTSRKQAIKELSAISNIGDLNIEFRNIKTNQPSNPLTEYLQ